MLSLLPLLASTAVAGEPTVALTPHVQVRPRIEGSTGRDGVAGQGDALIISQRSRLGGTLALGPVSARVLVQDVRAWGSETDTLKDFTADHLDVHVAALDWSPTDGLDLTVGRQELVLHEHRLIGTVDWTQQARAFDAARVRWTGGAMSVEAFGAMLYEGDQVDADTLDSTLFAARGGAQKDTARADLVAIYRHLGEADTEQLTVGAYATGGTGILSGRVEGYGQAGSAGAASIGAWMVGVRGTVAPEAGFQPTVTLWYDHLSGDGDLADDQLAAFDTLYATNHKFYGHMDLAVFSVGGIADGRGLQDVALKLGAQPTERVAVHLDGHAFLASAPQGGDTSLAQEVDAWTKVQLTEGLGLGVGGAVWLPSDDADVDGWVWAQLDAKL